jgi:hypothetical protein
MRKWLKLIPQYSITTLPLADEAEQLSDAYVAEKVIPVKFRNDGLHIAISTVNNLDMIISMNFQHIVKRKTIMLTSSTNVLKGYKAIEIFSPMEVIDNME